MRPKRPYLISAETHQEAEFLARENMTGGSGSSLQITLAIGNSGVIISGAEGVIQMNPIN